MIFDSLKTKYYGAKKVDDKEESGSEKEENKNEISEIGSTFRLTPILNAYIKVM